MWYSERNLLQKKKPDRLPALTQKWRVIGLIMLFVLYQFFFGAGDKLVILNSLLLSVANN